MAAKNVLVIEDDGPIRRGIVDALVFYGFGVCEAADGDTGSEIALNQQIDLVLLDIMLPRRNGLDVLRDVRDSKPTLPVILLTARGDEDDRVRGLRLGADDYVVKPFSVKELIARVEAVLRRAPERGDQTPRIEIPGGTIDLARREIRYATGDRIDLSQREAELIRYLAEHAGRAVARDEILTRVWQLDPTGVETRTIDMHVARLREKLGRESIIRTVRGKGYMWECPEPL
jgi:DNA-binding response OmpR family regulator